MEHWAKIMWNDEFKFKVIRVSFKVINRPLGVSRFTTRTTKHAADALYIKIWEGGGEAPSVAMGPGGVMSQRLPGVARFITKNQQSNIN